MLEWLKRHAWKACSRLKRLTGSNPVLSAEAETTGKPNLFGRSRWSLLLHDEKRRLGELKTAEMIGLEKGQEEGREEGREEASMSNAAKLKQLGLMLKLFHRRRDCRWKQ